MLMRMMVSVVMVMGLFIGIAYADEQEDVVEFKTPAVKSAIQKDKDRVNIAIKKCISDLKKSKQLLLIDIKKAKIETEDYGKVSDLLEHINYTLECLDAENTELEMFRIAKAMSEKSNAPKDAISYGGHNYKFFEGNITWTVAKEACEKMKGHLVCIETKEENDFIQKISKGKTIWIALAYEKDAWQWVNGSKPDDFSPWHAGESDDGSRGQVYAAMANGQWYSGPNSSPTVQGYVCEWDK